MAGKSVRRDGYLEQAPECSRRLHVVQSGTSLLAFAVHRRVMSVSKGKASFTHPTGSALWFMADLASVAHGADAVCVPDHTVSAAFAVYMDG